MKKEKRKWTGKKDLHGNKIYIDDFVRCYTQNLMNDVYYEPQRVTEDFKNEIWDETNCEVVGNLKDNPEIKNIRYPENNIDYQERTITSEGNEVSWGEVKYKIKNFLKNFCVIILPWVWLFIWVYGVSLIYKM